MLFPRPRLFLCPLHSSSWSSCSTYSLCRSILSCHYPPPPSLSIFCSRRPLPTPHSSSVLSMKMLTVGTGSSWPLSTTAAKRAEPCVCVCVTMSYTTLCYACVYVCVCQLTCMCVCVHVMKNKQSENKACGLCVCVCV